MKRPLAYITAPWSENEFENTENAAKYCRAVYDAGFSPICPTLFLPLFLRDEIPQEHKDGIDMAREYLRRARVLTLKGQMTHRVELGSDARGNLVRIENALDKMPERLRSVQEQLENLYNQQAAAKAEVGKPFPQEQELAAKTARLIELDMELNLDGKGQPQPEQAIAKSTRPSVLDRLKAPPVHGAPEKPHKKEMEAR